MASIRKWNQSTIYFLVYSISILSLSFLADQHDFNSIFSFYVLGFASYFLIGIDKNTPINWIKCSLWLKIILVFAFPLASDDIFRFYWDGMVSAQGISPYKSLPSELINNNSIYLDSSVYQKLNSKSYYSVYPPLLQLVFSSCYVLSFKSVYIFSVIWKLILLMADAGSIYLLKKLQYSSKLIYWFALNPLIIYEVFANGHPEGLLVFFLIGMIWALKENKINGSFISLSLASAIKIFPLVFFPLLVKKMRFGQVVKYSCIAAFFLLVFFLPIYPYFDHFMESIRLYFKKFEFNGSVFEIWKGIDYLRFGFDNIDHISIYLSSFFLLVLIVLSTKYIVARNEDLLKTMFWIWMFYLLFSSTVHPWYILPIFVISLLRSNLIGFVWSLLVILSYSAYHDQANEYRYVFLSIEYVLLLLTVVFEINNWSGQLKNLIFSDDMKK